MLEAAGSALEVIFTWPNILIPLLGTFVGLLVGILPGLGAAAGIALLIPLTYSWAPQQAFLLLASAIGGTSFSGSITAILINTPGENANAATLIDGYPMAKQGRASVALSLSAFASAAGALFGLLVLVAVLPVGRELILRFSYPETFMVAVMGLFIIALVSSGSLLKGLIAGGLGFVLALVGRDLLTGELRFTFGSLFLTDGIDFIAVLIGLFAVSEAMMLLIDPEPNLETEKLSRRQHWSQIGQGARLTFRNPRLLLQSSTIGTIAGIIPGVGGSVSSFMAYATAKSSLPDTQTFGSGDPRGVIAAEAANDAKDGGALIPTLAFGLPGSAVWAVVLGAFLIHGIAPGREMLTTDLDIVFVIIFGLIISNVLTSAIGLAASPFLAPVAKLPGTYVAPVIFAISLVGAYTTAGQRGDILIALIAGVSGYILKKNGFSLIPIVLALFLGPVVENSLGQLMLTLGPIALVTRPISLAILILGLLLFAVPLLRSRRERRRAAEARREQEEVER